MALVKFRAPAIPLPPTEYRRDQFDEIFRALRLYFNQLDSLTPNQADSYKADNFFGGDLSVDDATANFISALGAFIEDITTRTITNNYAKLESILNNRIVSKDVMAANFYGGTFEGLGNGVVLSHIAASDSTDQIAGGNNTATLVEWNTLESGFGWSLASNAATAEVAGVYTIRYSLQFINTANAQHYVTVWLQKNGSDVANSATIFAVPSRKSASPGEEGYLVAYSEATFTVAVGDDIELYWATDLAGNPTTPTDGIYMFHDAAQASPFARPAIPSAIGSITFVSAIYKIKVAPLSVYGYGALGSVTVLTV